MIKTVQRFEKTGSLQSLPRSGAPLKFTQRDQSIIYRNSINNPEKSSIDLSQEYNEFYKIKMSPQYVRRFLFKKGLRSYVSKRKPYLTTSMAKKDWHLPKNMSRKILVSGQMSSSQTKRTLRFK